MIKKIKAEQLKPGMFIYDMNCGWLQHPFLTNKIKLKSEKTIQKIIEYGIREVYIDTDKGLDIADAPTKEEVDRQIQEELNKIDIEKSTPPTPVPLRKELIEARKIRKEAKKTIQDIMNDVRFGGQIRTEKVEPVVEKMIDSIFRNQDALISLARIRQIDEYTYVHSMSVCVLMISFGKHLGFDLQQLKDIGMGAMLHDVGKMKVPQELLKSQRALTDEEFNQVKEHVNRGCMLLEQTGKIPDIAILVTAQHHERIDGGGYPNGLKGERISIFGQAAAITDVYDAMTSKRCYQRQYEPTEVLSKLFEWDNMYNRDLVQQFIRCIGIYPVGSLVRLEGGLLGVVLNRGEKSLLQPVVRIVYDTKKERHVYPYDIDLSNHDGQRVEGYALPEKWGINTEAYL